MYNLKNDYSNGCHPSILKRLIDTNDTSQEGYGVDEYSKEAKQLLMAKVGNPKAKVFFASGGTQANLLVIAALLKSHEAVISVKTGHISCHEAGAIESIGHKIITVDSEDGKLKPSSIEEALKRHDLSPHVVKPKMIYISNATELGTFYTRKELRQLSQFCKVHELFVFMDGARLGNALRAKGNDLSMNDISTWTDVFSIGGTKNGGLLGEAIIFNQAGLAVDFDILLKQKGALLSKSRVFGVQFLELFKDDLYFSLAEKANHMAIKLAKALQNEIGCPFLMEPTTNQIFPILPNEWVRILEQNQRFHVWKTLDDQYSAVRMMTSWNTQDGEIDLLIKELKEYNNDNE
ncbi:aminotransferase class I/II-fold pyridoxal phosphate-dependent enzyme [Galbibacter sp. PAP.153]|uniref:threonine aldolase family protein n=1 Tax=Galbibacter sp. PAP.153 TaxID=3104623 RepID=UPI00300AEEB9